MKKLLLAVLIVMVMATAAFGANSAGTSTCVNATDTGRFKVIKCTVDWLSDDATGAVSVTVLTTTFSRYIQTKTSPGASGDLATLLPTALYDITITEDTNTYDIAAAGLQNRSGTVSEFVAIAAPPIVYGTIKLNITNAGNGKKGRAVLTFME